MKSPLDSTRLRPADDPWRRFVPWRGSIEVLFWIVAFGASAIANVAVVLMDAERDGQDLSIWEPALWEGSSALVMLLLLPGLLLLCSRWPIHADNWKHRLPLYVAASIGWSVLHVLGMVALRKLGYALVGSEYDQGPWFERFLYEYLKDARTFSLIVLVDHGYRWFWRRIQGEARILDPPEDGSDFKPEPRPERFLVRKLGREFLIAAADIKWIRAAGNYVDLHVGERVYPLRSTMNAIEQRLDSGRFVRIHRSFIVHVDRISSIEPLDTGDARVHLADGTVLPCSRNYREAFRERLGRAGK